MAIHQNPDRDKEYMYRMWGTTNLITDYWSGKYLHKEQQELREVVGDDKEKKIKNSEQLNED